jgi:Protein of unknown function (DUF3606)
MFDPLKAYVPADRCKVNLHEPREVEYWTRKFGCSAEQLRAAVAKVGSSVPVVQTTVAGVLVPATTVLRQRRAGARAV